MPCILRQLFRQVGPSWRCSSPARSIAELEEIERRPSLEPEQDSRAFLEIIRNDWGFYRLPGRDRRQGRALLRRAVPFRLRLGSPRHRPRRHPRGLRGLDRRRPRARRDDGGRACWPRKNLAPERHRHGLPHRRKAPSSRRCVGLLRAPLRRGADRGGAHKTSNPVGLKEARGWYMELEAGPVSPWLARRP